MNFEDKQPSMSFASLLAGYATAKSAPPKLPPVKTEAPKHPLYDRLAEIRNTAQPILNHTGGDKSSNRVANLGILFIIIDDFPNELLWRLWLQQGCAESFSDATKNQHTSESDTNVAEGEQQSHADRSAALKVQMWFHAKIPDKVRSAWVRERLVQSFHFKPEWGSVEITKVMAHLLHEATHDAPHINKFCFASESCIPIVPLAEVLQRLYAPVLAATASTSSKPIAIHNNNNSTAVCTTTSDVRVPAASVLSTSSDCGISTDTAEVPTNVLEAEQNQCECLDYDSSWLSYTDTANNGYAHQLQFEPLKRALPAECIYKASQWLMLSRTHALAVLHVLQQLQQVQQDSPYPPQSSAPHNSEVLLSQDNSRSAAVPVLCERLFSIFKDVRASDEMFFPCVLALLGCISTTGAGTDAVWGGNAGKGTAVTKTAASATHTTDVNDDTHTTTATADMTRARARVLCQQVTYSDWTHSAKNPADYKDAFPAALAQALRAAHIAHTQHNSCAKSTGGSGGNVSGNKRKSSAESDININANQHSVVFLRKVKFPARLSSVDTISNSTAAVSTAAELTVSQDTFLRSWLPCILCPDESSHMAVQGAASASTSVSAVDDTLVEEWLQRAAELLHRINSTTAVPAPATAGSHSDRSAPRSGSTQGISNRDSRERWDNRDYRDYRDSGNGRYNDNQQRSHQDRYHSSNTGSYDNDGRPYYPNNRDSEDRYKRDRDQSDYAYDSKRYRY